MAALTGCGGDGEPASGGASGSAWGGDGKGTASRALSAEDIRTVLPTNESLGDVFVGPDAQVGDGDVARRQCAKDSGTACDGLAAAGLKEMAVRGNSDDREVDFVPPTGAAAAFSPRGPTAPPAAVT
ncbi:hypothetical protein [Streptomyces sp. NPDC089799]|uniref:hypothetical protein n=1 Tax=Streptomyces sp. NPDC089799 TaxID=3155066 RepID=UPI00343CF172